MNEMDEECARVKEDSQTTVTNFCDTEFVFYLMERSGKDCIVAQTMTRGSCFAGCLLKIS